LLILISYEISIYKIPTIMLEGALRVRGYVRTATKRTLGRYAIRVILVRRDFKKGRIYLGNINVGEAEQ
jgi:hypothetical protein